MSITELGDLAKWLEVTQSVVAIIGLPILTLTLLMIGRQAQYAHHTTMSQIYQNTADGFATVQRYFMDNGLADAGTAPNPVHRWLGRRFCRTDRRGPCGLAATPP